MPRLGARAEGTVSRWLVEVGGRVRANEPLLEVSTDEVDSEVASAVDGVLSEVLVPEARTVPVGTVLATLEVRAAPDGGVRDTDRTEYGVEDAVPVAPTTGSPAAPPVEDAALAGRPRRGPGVAAPGSAGGRSPRGGSPGGSAPGGRAPGGRTPGAGPAGRRPRHRDSPRVRRLARERGVDLEALVLSGSLARATVDDVEAAARRAGAGPAAAPAAPAPPSPQVGPRSDVRVEGLSEQRRRRAERLVASLRTAAQLTTVVEVDLSRVTAAAHDGGRQRGDAPLTVLGAVAEAAVRALGAHPVVNARLDLEAGTVTHPPAVDLGVTVDTTDGPVVAVVRGAQDLSVGGLARRIASVGALAQDGGAAADERDDATFTLTDTGSRGTLFDTPILDLPQSAVLGLGAVVRRPVVVAGPDGEDVIAVRSVAHLALTYDHRLVDGADAARFLGSVKERLEGRGAPRPGSAR